MKNFYATGIDFKVFKAEDIKDAIKQLVAVYDESLKLNGVENPHTKIKGVKMLSDGSALVKCSGGWEMVRIAEAGIFDEDWDTEYDVYDMWED